MYWVFMCNRSAHLAPPSPSAVSRVACKTCRTQFSDSGRHPLLRIIRWDDACIYGFLPWVNVQMLLYCCCSPWRQLACPLGVACNIICLQVHSLHMYRRSGFLLFFFFVGVMYTYIAHRSAICTPVCVSHLQPPPHQVRGIIILCSRIGLFDLVFLPYLPF